MYSHVMVGANDVQASKVFYDAVLGALGHEPGVMDESGRCFYSTPNGMFVISSPLDGKPATNGNGSTIGFTADSPAQADAWYTAGVAKGGKTCEDPPWVRESGLGTLYLAYLRDPSGNKICAFHKIS